MIRFDHVSFAYDAGDSRQPALRDVSFCLEPGEIVAVLGCNGSGKSTLGVHANGLLLPQEGRVTVDGFDTADQERLFDVRSRVGLVFQNPDNQIVSTSVEEDVAFGPENLGLPREEIRRRVDDAIAAVQLSGLEHREPHLLSGGQKQRLAIAGVLALRPRYVVLDEPGSMLDETSRRDIVRIIEELRSAGHGVLLITHELPTAAVAERALVLDAGSVVFEGSLADLLADAGSLEAWGLELPSIARLAAALRARGLDLPREPASARELVEAICP